MSSTAGIVFSSLNNNTLSRLTSDRTVAAIPFGCRYRLVDFALSNMVNANMSNISVVANYNYRSLLEHIGSGKDWDLARRENGINFVSPFQSAKNPTEAKMFSTHLEALKSMRSYIYELKEDFVVMTDADTIMTLDLSKIVDSHEKSGADITIVTKNTDKDFTAKHPRMMVSSIDGRIDNIAMSEAYIPSHPSLMLGVYVMKTNYLRKIIEESVAYNLTSFTELLMRGAKSNVYMEYKYDGYVAIVSSFLDYYRCSMEIAKNPDARNSLLGNREFPIFTRVHNSAPTRYKSTASVKNSLIADECVIEGEVENSIIFRGVKIEKGAKVKNSVLFRGVYVGKGATLNSIVADKDVYVSDGVCLSGNDNMPFYIQKSRKI